LLLVVITGEDIEDHAGENLFALGLPPGVRLRMALSRRLKFATSTQPVNRNEWRLAVERRANLPLLPPEV
jgi:hypothetical protein